MNIKEKNTGFVMTRGGFPSITLIDYNPQPPEWLKELQRAPPPPPIPIHQAEWR